MNLQVGQLIRFNVVDPALCSIVGRKKAMSDAVYCNPPLGIKRKNRLSSIVSTRRALHFRVTKCQVYTRHGYFYARHHLV